MPVAFEICSEPLHLVLSFGERVQPSATREDGQEPVLDLTWPTGEGTFAGVSIAKFVNAEALYVELEPPECEKTVPVTGSVSSALGLPNLRVLWVNVLNDFDEDNLKMLLDNLGPNPRPFQHVEALCELFFVDERMLPELGQKFLKLFPQRHSLIYFSRQNPMCVSKAPSVHIGWLHSSTTVFRYSVISGFVGITSATTTRWARISHCSHQDVEELCRLLGPEWSCNLGLPVGVR